MAFTDEQINEILNAVFAQQHTQYIGSRYVPIFGRKGESSIEWDNKAPYEPLSIVLHEGNSYTSKQYVPTGIDISNETYWAVTGNYNAQVELYRRETAQAQATAEKAQKTADTNTTKITNLTTKYDGYFNNMGVDSNASALEVKNHLDTAYNKSASNQHLLTAMNVTNDLTAGNFKAINVVTDLGVDNTGAKDCASILQSAADFSDKYYFYFPAGTYVINSEIVLKRDTKYPWRVECANGAYFTTTTSDSFKAFFTFSETISKNETPVFPFEGEEYFYGGTFNCKSIVESAIRLERYHSTVQNVLVYNAKTVGLFGGFINNFINCTILERDMKTSDVTGIECSYDSYISGCKIFWCKTGIKCGGNTRIIGNNIWSGMRSDSTTGVEISKNSNHVTVLNNYFDTLNLAVNVMTTTNCNGEITNNLMFYSGTKGYNDLLYIGVKIDAWTHIITSNSYSNYKSGRRVYGTVTTYLDVSMDYNNRCNDQYEQKRMPLQPRCMSSMVDEMVIVYPKTPRVLNQLYTIGWIPTNRSEKAVYEFYNNGNESRQFEVSNSGVKWIDEKTITGFSDISLGTPSVDEASGGILWFPVQIKCSIATTESSTGSYYLRRIRGMKMALEVIERAK